VRQVTTENGKATARGAFLVEYRCRAKLRGPIRVGTGESLSVVTDAPILRDGLNRPYLPGAGIRGILREFCEREAPLMGISEQIVTRLFGPSSEALAKAGQVLSNVHSTADQKAAALEQDRQGRLTVLDAALDDFVTEVRDHVSLSREWGATTKGAKFDQEVAHAAAALLVFRYEGDSESDDELRLLRAGLWALQEGALALGGKSGWGLGEIAKMAVAETSRERSEAEGLADYLSARFGGTSTDFPSEEKIQPIEYPHTSATATSVVARLPPWSWLRLRVRLCFDGPVLISGPYYGDLECNEAERKLRLGSDAVYQTRPDGTKILSGSSLRGALQAQARRISRTLWEVQEEDDDKVARLLFGHVKRSGTKERGRRGLLRVGEGTLIGESPPLFIDHVAIDRVSGFAADTQKFDTVALQSPRFEHTLFLRWNHGNNEEMAAVALFMFALRDAELGWVWVGSRTTRGYGHLRTIGITECVHSVVENGQRLTNKWPTPPISIAALAQDPVLKHVLEAWEPPMPTPEVGGADD